MPTGDVIGGLLGGIAQGAAAKKARDTQRKTDDSLESINQAVGRMIQGDEFEGPIRPIGSRKKGGRIKKTGFYLLHKGENVESEQEVKSRKKDRKTSRSSGRR